MIRIKSKARFLALSFFIILLALSLAGFIFTKAPKRANAVPTGSWSNFTENWAEGNGTSGNPYIIDTPGRLAMLLDGTSHYGLYFSITTDLDMGAHIWNGQGTQFYGTLNGNNNTVKNLYANFCMFNYGGTIRNIVFDNIETGSGWVGLIGSSGYTSVVIASTPLEISNVVIQNSTLTVAATGSTEAGFLISRIQNDQSNGGPRFSATFTVQNCKVINSSLTADRVRDMGGIVGFVQINDSLNEVRITGNSVSNSRVYVNATADRNALNFSGIGGVAGTVRIESSLTAFKFTFENNTVNESEIMAEKGFDQDVGGMIGSITSDFPTNRNNREQKLSITNCHVAGGIIENRGLSPNQNEIIFLYGRVGGILGNGGVESFLELYKCTNSALISGGADAGGLIGFTVFERLELADCYNRGNIRTPSDQRAAAATSTTALCYGGLVGYSRSIIVNITRVANLGNIDLNAYHQQGVLEAGGLFGRYYSYTEGFVQNHYFIDAYTVGHIRVVPSGGTLTAGNVFAEPLIGKFMLGNNITGLYSYIQQNPGLIFNNLYYTGFMLQDSYILNNIPLSETNRAPGSKNFLSENDFVARPYAQVFSNESLWSWHGMENSGGYTVPKAVHVYAGRYAGIYGIGSSYPTLGAAAAAENDNTFKMANSDNLQEAVVIDKPVTINTNGYTLGGSINSNTAAAKVVSYTGAGSLTVSGRGSVSLETDKITLNGMERYYDTDNGQGYNSLRFYSRSGKNLTVKVTGQNAAAFSYGAALRVYGNGETIIEGDGVDSSYLSLASSANEGTTEVMYFEGSVIIRNIRLRFDHVNDGYGRPQDAIFTDGIRLVIDNASLEFIGHTITGAAYAQVGTLMNTEYYGNSNIRAANAQLIFVYGSGFSMQMRTEPGGTCITAYAGITHYGTEVRSGVITGNMCLIRGKAAEDTITAAGYKIYEENTLGTGHNAGGKWYTDTAHVGSLSVFYGSDFTPPAANNGFIYNAELSKTRRIVNADYSGYEPVTFYYDLETELRGTAEITGYTGSPRIGNTLTAALTGGGSNTGTLTYTWKAGAETLGTGNSYTVKTADLGKTITVEITSSTLEGTVISGALPAVLKKAAPAAPGVPTLVSKTHNTVTLTLVSGYEYARIGGSWSTNNVFTGLTPGTTYNFMQKIAETADTLGSSSSAFLSVTTDSIVNVQTPNITTQPSGGILIRNTAYTLSVTASVLDGGQLTYQWYSNTSQVNSGGNLISGATSATYSVPTANAGTFYYYCIITNTITDNGDGGTKTMSIATNAVNVTVNKTGVTAASLQGVTNPATGKTPSTNINNGTGFTSALAWDGSPSVFEQETVYTATVTLTAAQNYGFFGIANSGTASGFKINGIAPAFVSNDGEVLVLKYTFPATAAAINAQAPVISSQPVGGTYYQNDTPVALTLTANSTDGGAVSYQWYRNNVNSIAGASMVGINSSSYTPSTASAGTLYYFCVVTNTITNNGDGGAKTAQTTSDIISITVNAKTYGISLSVTGTHTFTEREVGYGPQTALTITITNTGNQNTGTLSIGLSGTNAGSFTNSTTIFTGILAGSSVNFTVVPNTGLAAGTYTATVTVSGSQTITPQSFNVVFKVNAVPVYSAEVNPTLKDFAGADYGYGTQPAQVFTIRNTGNQALTNISAALQGANAGAFEISAALSGNSIGVNGSLTISVRPKTGLVIGSYSGTLKITGNNGIDISVNLTFNVSEAEVSLFEIQGIPLPVAGEIPVTNITETAEYTGTVSWSPSVVEFDFNTVYTATITLQIKSGYTLINSSANLFSVGGAETTTHTGNGIIIAVFRATGSPADMVIDIDAIGGVAAPVGGETPVSVITETAQFYGEVTWTPSVTVFGYETVYIATITVIPKEGFTLAGVPANFFNVAGAEQVANPANSGVITVIFPATDAQKFSVTINGITGSTSYYEGDTVSITAGTAPAGKVFDRWTSSSGIVFDDPYAASTTFIMPASEVNITAVFKDLPGSTYNITVQNDGNGTASANVNSAAAGTEITLTATAKDGYKFKEWQVVSGGITVANNKFTMPSGNVTIKAIFEPDTVSKEPQDGKDGLSGGAVAGIIAGSVIGVGLAGFAVYWFAIRKKKVKL